MKRTNKIPKPCKLREMVENFQSGNISDVFYWLDNFKSYATAYIVLFFIAELNSHQKKEFIRQLDFRIEE